MDDQDAPMPHDVTMTNIGLCGQGVLPVVLKRYAGELKS